MLDLRVGRRPFLKVPSELRRCWLRRVDSSLFGVSPATRPGAPDRYARSSRASRTSSTEPTGTRPVLHEPSVIDETCG